VQLPHLDANQLKLFQQLTQTVNYSEAKTPPIRTHQPPPAPATASSEVVAGPSNPPTYWNNPRITPDKPWDAGSNYQASPLVEENNYHGHRGRFRGGYRSRGRGRFGDRDREGYRERFYDTARSPPGGHGRTSRSRSPPRSRYGGASRRDIKPYSPPHRPSVADQPDLDAAGASSSQQHPGVDEFGREIRPSSDDDGRRSETSDDPKPRPAPPPPAAQAHAHLSPTSNLAVVEGSPPVSDEQESSAFATTPQTASANAAGVSEALHQVKAGDVGLESFDYSTFDPTSPSSWETLGKAWAALAWQTRCCPVGLLRSRLINGQLVRVRDGWVTLQVVEALREEVGVGAVHSRVGADAGGFTRVERVETAGPGGSMEAMDMGGMGMRMTRMRSSWGSTLMISRAARHRMLLFTNRWRKLVRVRARRATVGRVREVGCRKWGIIGCLFGTMVLHSSKHGSGSSRTHRCGTCSAHAYARGRLK